MAISETNPSHLINAATLPSESRNTENTCEHSFSFLKSTTK